ncbi:MAG TPA: hypothetical protein VKU00_19585 [Chthonomonadaceae bacterium]|nr:hypothetical protein [Chthonomonadaceae bacterium]
MIGTLGHVRADFASGHGFVLQPNNPTYVGIQVINDQVYVTCYYIGVTALYYTDGTEQDLDTSDGSSYVLTFTNGNTATLTHYDVNDQPVDQWISTAN